MRLLLTGTADRLHFGKMLTHYERQADGTVTAFFSDQHCRPGQILVGQATAFVCPRPVALS